MKPKHNINKETTFHQVLFYQLTLNFISYKFKICFLTDLNSPPPLDWIIDKKKEVSSYSPKDISLINTRESLMDSPLQTNDRSIDGCMDGWKDR